MAYATTYTTLKADLVRITEDASTDYADNIDTIIALSELSLQRDLDLECFKGEASSTLLNGSHLISRGEFVKVTDVLVATLVGIEFKPLLERTYSYILQMYPSQSQVGEPVYYTQLDDVNIYVAPGNLTMRTAKVLGVIRPDGLSITNQTTWLSNNVGDLLLLQCLIGSEEYLDNPGGAGVWKSEYADKLAKARVEFRGFSRADYQLGRSIASVGNPL